MKPLSVGLANERRRFGYRRLFVLLRREGEPSGINRINRLYREEGQTVRKRKARHKVVETRAPMLVEARPNARWSLDFFHNQFANGQRFRVLIVVDDVTRESLAATRTEMTAAPVFFAVASALVDIAANLMLQKSRQFTHLAWGIGAILLVWFSFWLLGWALVGMKLSVAYVLWGMIGVTGTAILGRLVFGQRLTPTGWLGIALIIAAVIVLALG